MTCGYASGVDAINADRWPAVIDVRMAAGLRVPSSMTVSAW
jgi:hypothetical protein